MLTTGQDTQSVINSAQAQARYNNQWSAGQAEIQRNFQEQSNARAMAFSAKENQKNREFQQYNTDTAHQREVKDLIKAGLNPILSANKGASVPAGNSAQGVSSQGAKGETDTGVTQLFNGLLQAIIGQATALQTTSMNNQTSLNMTSMNNQVAEIISKIQAGAMLGSANINASSNQKIQQMQQQFEEFMKKNYPQNMFGAGSAGLNWLTDLFKYDGSSSKYTADSYKRIEELRNWFKNLKPESPHKK